MWRAFFLAVGAFAILLGAQCLAVEKAVMHAKKEPATSTFGFSKSPARKEMEPPEWAPWTLLSGGAVVLIYSFTLPKRGEHK
ncbi:MAG: hypothetical protein AB7O62_13200 [Pirellulales bacterium]